MTQRWLILADDLTGAADCAIPFARQGHAAVVGWNGASEGAAQPDVFSYNVDSRGLAADAAAELHRQALHDLLRPGAALFKKIDSTLRGQPAAEIAATLAHLKGQFGGAFGVFAPAFPATRRTTLDGRILVDGQPLEQAEVWMRDHSYASAHLPDVLASAGIETQVVPLASIRSGQEALKAAFARIASHGDIIAVCDAETDDDLRRIAEASLPLAPGTFLIGSAGLAAASAMLSPAEPDPIPSLTTSPRGFLMVVGSLAAASRRGARKLVARGRMAHVPVSPDTLLCDTPARIAIGRDIAARLDAGKDVLVEIGMDDAPQMASGPSLAKGLADTLAPAAGRMSAFAATGGETAAALLSSFGVTGIRLIDEIEPGVVLGQAIGALSCPVVTKAGAFGDDDSLGNIADRLHAIRTQGKSA